jgi:hypothetical protein
MENVNNEFLMKAYMVEYERLKQEQTQRIGFRDNLMYANLVAITGVISIAIADKARLPVLLVLPLVNLALGWTYLVNDQKISAMGRYFRTTLSDKVKKLIGTGVDELWSWEIASQGDTRRKSRKIFQLLVDEIMFVLPGVIAIVLFWALSGGFSWLHGIAIVGSLLLVFLAVQIGIYAELRKE